MTSVTAVVLFLSIGLFDFVSLQKDESCSINVNRDLPKDNEPLMLTKSGSNYTLLIPHVQKRNGVIELAKGEEVVLACPGKNNYLREGGEEVTSTSCVSGTKLYSDDSKKTFSVEKASCEKPVEAEVKSTSARCAQTGKIYEVGFQAQGWHVMVSVCHDPTPANSLYSKHTLIGAALQGAVHESRRPQFHEGSISELYKNYNPNNFYVKKAQKTLFDTLFGAVQAKKYFDENDYFLSRGHLAPDADFIFGAWQFATYFYVNAAPQWQVINGGNWLTVEKMVRKLAISTKEDLTVVTGTHGILELADAKGKPVQLYLNNQKRNIPVPSYFWKVVYNPATKQGAALVTSNNPFLPPDSKIPFCQDVCQTYGWTFAGSTKDFANVTQGVTACCTFAELRKEVPHVPFLDVQSMLRGPPRTTKTHGRI